MRGPIDDTALGAGPPSATSVMLFGRAGVTLDVVAHTLRTSGRDIFDLAALERDPTQHVIAVVVRPTEADWSRVERVGADAIAIIDSDDEIEIADAFIRGAEAVITTHSDPDDLDKAVDVVAAGGSIVQPDIARSLLQHLRTMIAERPAMALTPRETDILLSIEQGDSIKQTARSLGISEKTVQNLQSRLFNKLRARNRAQAITRAHELGLLRAAWVR